MGDLWEVPRLTKENDPESGATRFMAFGPSCKTQSIASLRPAREVSEWWGKDISEIEMWTHIQLHLGNLLTSHVF